MTMAREIWVWLPRDREGAPTPVTAELLYEARALCRRFTASLVALSDRDPAPGERNALRRWGVEEIRSLGRSLAPHPLFPAGRAPLAAMERGGPPQVFLLADDATGRVIAPLWAAESGAAFIPAITGITAEGAGGRLVVARPTLGEQYEALVRVEPERPLVATLLPGAVGEVAPPATAATQGEPAVRHLAPPPGFLPEEAPHSVLPPDPATLDIADAERIVAFGRGAFSEEAVALVRRLADLLGAAVAGTRPAADEGWLPFARQVGLTGAIVRPRLYVAVGISGAPYHMVGIREPETLIAINADPEAPIFGSADLGVVGDLYRVLPEIIVRLEQGRELHGAAQDVAAGRSVGSP